MTTSGDREVYFWWEGGWYYGWGEEDDYDVGPFRRFLTAWDNYSRPFGAVTIDYD